MFREIGESRSRAQVEEALPGDKHFRNQIRSLPVQTPRQ